MEAEAPSRGSRPILLSTGSGQRQALVFYPDGSESRAEGGAERLCIPEAAPAGPGSGARGPAAPHPPTPGPNRAHWTPSKWDSRDKRAKVPHFLPQTQGHHL